MKSLSVRCFAALAAVALLAPAAAAPARAAEPYQINTILSLTGPLSFLGLSQQLSLKTIETLVNKKGGINGQPIHFVIVDDASQPAVAVQLANGIIAKHVPIIMGPTYSASCDAIGPVVRTNGPVDYCFAPTIHPPAGSYQFSGGASILSQAEDTLTFARAKGWKRLAAIATTDATGQDIEEQFGLLLGKGKFADMSLVANERFNIADVSLSAQLAKIKASNPDAVLAMSVGPATGTFLRDYKDAGMDSIPVISNLGNLMTDQIEHQQAMFPKAYYLTAPRFYAHDVSGKGPVQEAQATLFSAFNTQGLVPDVGNGFSWDPALIVVDGLHKLGTTVDAKALRDYILAMHSFVGPNGTYDFRDGSQRGQDVNTLVMVKWDPAKNKMVTVSDPGGKPLPRE
jgi:branched-chain amino acid transport system substrate-binding protein